ncbi:MAG: hypothetical protein ACOY0T_38645 [Myxococcota bacterium]
MTQADLSEELRRFLMVYVHSFEDLEVLLLAHRSGGKALVAEQVAEAVRLDPELASEALGKLAELGLLSVASNAPLAYEYSPQPALAERVEELAKAYVEQRFSVIAAVGSNAIVRLRTSAIKTFAESFLLRKGPKK